jgi:hypothetical protein
MIVTAALLIWTAAAFGILASYSVVMTRSGGAA